MMITIANGTILYGEDLEVISSNILIDDGKIIEISDNIFEGEIIDASNCIVCPSFLNAHTHIGDSIVKDIGDGESIEKIVKPPNGLKHIALNESSDDDLIDSMKSSMKDMLETGTTHFIDYREGGVKGVKLLKKAAKNIPINPIILGRDNCFFEKDPNLAKVKIAIKKLLKNCEGIAPSGFGEITNEVANLIVAECEKKGKISSIHAGEYESIQKDSLAKTGKTEIQRAINLGININSKENKNSGFNQLIHIVSPLNNDLDLIANYKKNIVLCPRSNGAFSLGIPPLFEILKKGIKPLIGTDNIMINSPNIFRELEYTLKIMRAYYKEYISPLEILKMATTNICAYSQSPFDKIINKSIIKENHSPELFIAKKISKNPYLSLINRVEKNDIKFLVNNGEFINFE